MGFWFIVWWAIKLVSLWMVVRSLTAKPDAPQPKGLSDFALPTIDGSRPIPVAFGTCKITGAAVMWYGDFSTHAVHANDDPHGQVVGYGYHIGMDLGLCHGPIDEVVDVLFDDKSGGWTFQWNEGLHEPAGTGKVYSISNGTLFGGSQGGGGVQGLAYVYDGGPGQSTSDYMRQKVSADYPGLATLAHIVFRSYIGQSRSGFYVGNSEYLKPMAVIVTRCPNQLGLTGGKHRTSFALPGWGHDANPACILYEVLTDTVWGLGLTDAVIDKPSFVAAGNTLFDEGFGLSMLWEQSSEAKDFLAEVLRHIDADLYADPESGKITLKLVRGDYDVSLLPVFDESCIESVTFTRRSWSETANVAQITFTSRFDGFNPRTAVAFDSANLRRRGEKAPLAVEFRGIATDGPAALAATRVLRPASRPFAQLDLVGNRKLYKLRPASVFVLNWPPLGISGMVVRVVRPADSKLEDGRISLKCVEDAFAVANAVYANAPPGDWIDPLADPVPITKQRLLELPYHLAGAARRVAALAGRDSQGESRFEIWTDPAGGTSYLHTGDGPEFLAVGVLAGTATLGASYPPVDATGTILLAAGVDDGALVSVSDADWRAGSNLALVESEILAWKSYDQATRTVTGLIRGLFGTVPGDHNPGSSIYFFRTPLPELASAPYGSDVTVSTKLLPVTVRATLPIGSASAVVLATTSLYTRPLAPGHVRVSGYGYPTSLSAGVDVVLAWYHRNRLEQLAAAAVVDQDWTSPLWTRECDYSVQVKVEGVVKRTVTVSAGSADTWTWTAAMQVTDSAVASNLITITITPVIGALAGTPQVREFVLT